MPCDCTKKPKVIDSRGTKASRTRRYKCAVCGARWSTCEVPVRVVVRQWGAKSALESQHQREAAMRAMIEV